jgi:hypothetical protein
MRVMGGPSSFVRRQVMDGMCNLNKPEFSNHAKCHAGGNQCWTRIVEVETAQAFQPVPPQAIQQALDNLDLRWRLAFARPIVRLPAAEDIGVLAVPCDTRNEFERRLSSIADILKRLDIGDDLLPEGEALDKSHTLDRLDRVFGSRLDAPDLANVQEA